MIRNCMFVALVVLAAGSFGCRACDDCYEEGPIVGGGTTDCSAPRSGSVSGAYPGSVQPGPPVYTQPGTAQPVQPAPARPLVPVRPGG